jgi:glutathione S-transferase
VITLFHRPRTRSSRFIFLLEELEAPYQVKLVTTRTADGTGAVDPANPHPHGKVPAIIDDGILVFESPAIALYLTDKYPLQRLGPVIGDHDRGAYLSWLCYYSGVLEPAFISRFMNIEPRGTAGWVPVEEAILAVTNALTPGPYMLGERFSAVDVLYGTTFAMFAKSPMMPKSAVIDEYVKRIVARPAFARAQARDGG